MTKFRNTAKRFIYGEPRPLEPTLPPGIRMAISHNAGETDADKLRSLFVPAYHQQRFGFYLLMKAAAENDALQTKLLQDLASRNCTFSELPESSLTPTLAYLSRQAKPTVEANKLAEISRYGISNWVERYQAKLASIDRQRPIFALAHASLIGIDVLIQHNLIDSTDNLHILKPNRFNQTELPVGFRLSRDADEPNTISVTTLSANFERPTNAIIFDDIRNTGTAMVAAQQFWMRQSGTPADFETVLRTSANRS